MSLISVTPKMDSFVKFCSEQDGGRRINHFTYDTCAIGDLMEANGECRDGAYRWFHGMLYEVKSVSKELGAIFHDHIGSGHPELSTYAGMNQYLTKFQHDLKAVAQ